MKALRNVTFLRLSSPSRGEKPKETRNIAYRADSSDPKHRLDVYTPHDGRSLAVVHFVHGGYWVAGDKNFHSWLTRLYGSVGRALAAQGVTTVVQSYRLGSFVHAIDDVMAALRWTQENLNGPLFVMGHSAGGHLIALAGMDDALHRDRGMNPDAVTGYIPISAIWDVETMHSSQDAAFNERVTYRVFGRDPAAWRAASPIHQPPAKHPFLVMIGENDYAYLVPQAERAREKLGTAASYYVAKGNDHDAMVLEFGSRTDNLTGAVVDFVKHATIGR